MVGIKHESMRKGQTSHKKEHNTRMCFPLKPVFTRDKGGLPNFIDEPTSGLDPFMRDEILDILYEFTREEDQSVLISSHIVSDLERICDYIAYIDQGSLKLYEEKDCLIEQYGILKCSKEELKEFDEQAVKGVRENPYGVEALVDRSKMPKDYETDMATLEEIIVFLSKGQEE